ncbi:hypothetical protein LOK74_03330 [Brevibacillus humidisoli]|uniref:hypothetical protein n=1 Tax=Brevibacillus humidisoli TaxID=2895522 RepID=UPI001E53193B|nr:hypothetical protein [Brevibacillus humidisoli]UFJ41577.1 hypothetical protein LOK74_03330 [Brevibacillus humidisoli]
MMKEQKAEQLSLSLQQQVPFSSLLYRVEDANETKMKKPSLTHKAGGDYRYLYWEEPFVDEK